MAMHLRRTVPLQILDIRPWPFSLAPAVVVILLFKLALSDGGRDLTAAALALSGLFALLGILFAARELRWTPPILAVLFMVVAVAASAVPSIRPDSSVKELLFWSAFLAVTWIISSTIHSTLAARRLTDAFLVIGGWLVLVGLYLFWGAGAPQMRWYATFYYPNAFAGFLLLLLPLALTLLLHARAGREALSIGALCVLLAVSFILTYSRGAYLALLAVAPVFFAFQRPPSWTAAVRRLALVALMIPLAVTILTRSPGGILTRAATAADVEGYSQQGRLHFWAAGLAVFSDYPLLGTGAGTYAYASAAYLRDIRFYAQDPHNLYVKTLAETGLLGATGLGLVLLVLAGLWLRGLRATRGTEAYPLVVGVGVGLAAFLLHSGVEMNWLYPANPAMAFALIGVLASPGLQGSHFSPLRIGSRARLVGIVLAVVALGATQVIFASERDFASARVLARAGQWSDMERVLRRAARLNPLNARFPSAIATVRQASNPSDPEVVPLIRRSLRLDRTNPHYVVQLTQAMIARGIADEREMRTASALLRQAITLDPYHYPQAYRLLASLAVSAGDRRAAERTFQESLRRYDLQLVTGDHILVVRLWPGVLPLYTDWAGFLANDGRAGQAISVLRQVLQADPRAVPAHIELARLYALRGDRSAAERQLREGLRQVPASEALWVRLQMITWTRSRPFQL